MNPPEADCSLSVRSGNPALVPLKRDRELKKYTIVGWEKDSIIPEDAESTFGGVRLR